MLTDPIIKLPLIQTIYDETVEMIVEKSLWEALFPTFKCSLIIHLMYSLEERSRKSGFLVVNTVTDLTSFKQHEYRLMTQQRERERRKRSKRGEIACKGVRLDRTL